MLSSNEILHRLVKHARQNENIKTQMEAGRRRKYQRKDEMENKAAPGSDRWGSVLIIHCCHVGFIMSAAGLHHFLLLGVSRPVRRADRKGFQFRGQPVTANTLTRNSNEMLQRPSEIWPETSVHASIFSVRCLTVTSGTYSINPTLLWLLQTWGPERLRGSRWLAEDKWKESSREQKTNRDSLSVWHPAAPHLIITCLLHWVIRYKLTCLRSGAPARCFLVSVQQMASRRANS